MDEEQKVSKYNSAVAQLVRIDGLWADSHKHARAGDYSSWNSDLDKIYSELTRDLREGSTKEKEIRERFNDFAKKLAKIGPIIYVLNGFNPNKDYNKSSRYYEVLLEKEIWLGRLQNELGKGTKWDDSDDEETE